MSRLIMDDISARTLPVLDNMYVTDNGKFHSTLKSTPVEPLRRLFKASIARQVNPGYGFTGNDAADFIELVITRNLYSTETDNNIEQLDEDLEKFSKELLEKLLLLSIVRYQIFN